MTRGDLVYLQHAFKASSPLLMYFHRQGNILAARRSSGIDNALMASSFVGSKATLRSITGYVKTQRAALRRMSRMPQWRVGGARRSCICPSGGDGAADTVQGALWSRHGTRLGDLRCHSLPHEPCNADSRLLPWCNTDGVQAGTVLLAVVSGTRQRRRIQR
jgi:hypothetical protein